MNNFTLNLYTLEQDPNFNLFDFQYDFYTENQILKNDFERIFKQYYLDHEIAFETVYMFKRKLQARLNYHAAYYKKLYETELATIDTDFLSNKFYDETITRDITGSQNELLTNNLKLNTKDSNLANGVADIGLSQDKLTGVSESANSGTSENEKTNIGKETITTHGKGSIGVVTNDVMLEGWRSILQDINQKLINDCRSLFLYIY